MTNTPDEHDRCTAETAITLLLMLARQASRGQRQMLSGKTLGLIGFGASRLETARKAHFGFGMTILIHDQESVCDTVLDQVAARRIDDIDHLIGLSDFVSLHCQPGTENRHLIDALRLNRMQPDAYLINTASSDLVDEEALADALWYDTIAGAGLQGHHDEAAASQRLLACENAIFLPHMAGTTRQFSETAGQPITDNLLDFHAGHAFRNRVA